MKLTDPLLVKNVSLSQEERKDFLREYKPEVDPRDKSNMFTDIPWPWDDLSNGFTDKHINRAIKIANSYEDSNDYSCYESIQTASAVLSELGFHGLANKLEPARDAIMYLSIDLTSKGIKEKKESKYAKDIRSAFAELKKCNPSRNDSYIASKIADILDDKYPDEKIPDVRTIKRYFPDKV